MEPWRSLLEELTQVLETEFAKLQKLEKLAKQGIDAGLVPELAVKAPPKPMLVSNPGSPITSTPVMEVSRHEVDSSWMLEKAVTSLPPVAADVDDLKSDAVERVTRSIQSFERRTLLSETGPGDTQTHFRVVRASKYSPLMQQRPWYIINPDQSKFASRWQALVACCLLFVALATPVQVALLEPHMDWLFFAGLAVDVVFVIDLVLQFFTAYPVTTQQGVMWEVRFPKIRDHYFKSLDRS